MRDIRYATLIHAPREDVFRAVATADGWNGWYTSECELDPVPGGVFHLVWRDFGPNRTSKSDVGRVVEVSAPERIGLKSLSGSGALRVNKPTALPTSSLNARASPKPSGSATPTSGCATRRTSPASIARSRRRAACPTAPCRRCSRRSACAR